MQKFKSIILPMQGHNKKDLHWLYNTSHEDESELKFTYRNLQFWFGGTSYRSSERLLLYIQIPATLIAANCMDSHTDSLPLETCILHTISPILAELSKTYRNTVKNVREKAQFSAQEAGGYIMRRNGIHYDREQNTYVLRMRFNVPLVNALSVNAKAAISAIRDILDCIEAGLKELGKEKIDSYSRTYENQLQIRQYMKKHELCVFVANGSILPRENGTAAPMKNAVPFITPPELEVKIPLAEGTELVGMGIPNGVTVITGGGYSGKSTLLDAIEMGIYNHVPGDGREYVLTDETALKIYSEDGRPVSELDMSPFFRYLPGEVKRFSTPSASGSVSQAANVIEAVCGQSKLLLFDEDKSATNFMIRDENMRLLVEKEPVIPFTDRVRELHAFKDISTILVIGGSSEYLSYADTVILMEDYLPKVATEMIHRLRLSKPTVEEKPADWTESRKIVPEEKLQPFLFFRNVKTDNKRIMLDEHSADIIALTALVSGDQLNMLAAVMEKLMTDKEIYGFELLERAEAYVKKILSDNDTLSLLPEVAQQFYEEVRPIDVFCCMNRMRGVRFNAFEGKMNE